MISDARVCASQLCLTMESDHTDCGLAGESSLHNEADECIFGDMESYVYMFVCMYLLAAKTTKSCFRLRVQWQTLQLLMKSVLICLFNL